MYMVLEGWGRGGGGLLGYSSDHELDQGTFNVVFSLLSLVIINNSRLKVEYFKCYAKPGGRVGDTQSFKKER